MSRLYIMVLVAGATAACRTTNEPVASKVQSEAGNAAAEGAPIRLIPDTRLAVYKAALPRVAYERLAAIFADPETIWYDHEAVPPAYQDTVGSVAGSLPVGPRLNKSGRGLIVEPGKKLFLDDGSAWEFPFTRTAGTDRSDNVVIVDFVHLPKVDGKRAAVALRTDIDANKVLAMGLARWEWVYPKGTTFGELVFVRAADGELLPAEVRTRVRYLSGWATNAYRPFPTAVSLAQAIKAARPNWENDAAIKSLVAHLTGNAPLEPLTLESKAFKDSFKQQGHLDVLPEIADVALVKELLRGTTFSSAYGREWRRVGGDVTYAASSAGGTSIVPRRYEAGLIEVSDVSCARCHQDAGRMIENYVPDAVLYGDLWGTDRIFSFHPFSPDPALYPPYGGEDRRKVRDELKDVFQAYDPSVHKDDMYRWLPRPGTQPPASPTSATSSSPAPGQPTPAQPSSPTSQPTPAQPSSPPLGETVWQAP